MGQKLAPCTGPYSVEERGVLNTPNYRVFIRSPMGLVSPFHDIPLYADQRQEVLNMVVEMPRWTNAKMEISKLDSMNPIMQDVQRGRLRYVANCFPYHGVIWNYGALPQTWENPFMADEITGCRGDNDPLDVVEIGQHVAYPGEVMQVKVLGAIALIDQGESDWKIIALNVDDPLAHYVDDVGDVEIQCPGLLRATVEWFRIYKKPDGKPENKFAFGGKAKTKILAYRLIQDMHRMWMDLVKKKKTPTKGISCANTTVRASPFRMQFAEAETVLAAAAKYAAAKPYTPAVDRWYFD